MTGRDNFRVVNEEGMSMKPGEVEITKLLEEAGQQYEEYVRLAELSDFPEVNAKQRPRYSWDNPIGLVVTESRSANLE